MIFAANLQCTATGEIRKILGAWGSKDDTTYLWEAGPYSCDCTRAAFFHGFDRVHRPCGAAAFVLLSIEPAPEGNRSSPSIRIPTPCPRQERSPEVSAHDNPPAPPAARSSSPKPSSGAYDVKRPTTADLKARLTMPDVWHRLGLGEFPGRPKAIVSPLRPGDTNPSFSLYLFEGEWRWKDHATGEGGDQIQLIQLVRSLDFKGAIGVLYEWYGWVEPVNVPTKTKSGEQLHHQATYTYRDATGRVVFEKWRMLKEDGSKTFFWRRPAREGEEFNGKPARRDRNGGWWIWAKGSIEPILYRLPQLLTSDPATAVYIVEGEKDADNAATELGWVTTTVPDGAKSWRTNFREFFQGRHVKIVPDNDEPGRELAARIARDLHGFASTVTIVDLRRIWPEIPEKGDISDYLTWKRAQTPAPAP